MNWSHSMKDQKPSVAHITKEVNLRLTNQP